MGRERARKGIELVFRGWSEVVLRKYNEEGVGRMVVIIDLIPMPKKVKSTSCTSGWCKNHLFEMEGRKHSDCYYRKKLKLRLCPKHNP